MASSDPSLTTAGLAGARSSRSQLDPSLTTAGLAGARSSRSQPNAPTVEELLALAVGAVPDGMDRPGQRQMANAIADAVRDGEHLLVQAGTGTGKSLAYLVPSLLVAGPVVVSTATLALQSQLVDHDLPRLANAVAKRLRRGPTFAVLKGRHHYLCLAKLEGGQADEPDALFDPGGGGGSSVRWLGEAGRLGKQVQRIREWAEQTDTGDRDELDPGVDDSAWRQVSTPARECVGAAKCPFGSECFAERSRAVAREVDVVVTNHSLLAFDMLAGRHIIPPHRLLVIDEAHELADRVSSATQAELTTELVDRTARRARSFVDSEAADRIVEAGDALAAGLAPMTAGRLVDGLPGPLTEALTLLDAAVRRVLERIGDVKADDPDPVAKQQARAVLTEVDATAQRMLAGADHDVIWVERDERRRALVAAPLSVAGTLRTFLYDERIVVATSATLAVGGNFETVARSLGLALPRHSSSTVDLLAGDEAEESEPPPWRSLDVGSPFDYRRQGILYVAAHLPRPAESGLPEPAARELVRLVRALGGRTLGLFSSRRAAGRAAEVLRAETDLEILVQGEEALPLLVRRFRDDPSTCLLGVMSLWQGVDVPGDACQLVVIDRLPFPRPDEPLAAARAAAVDAAGGSGFASVSVPIAAVRLAQGVGRLIRTAGDRGVVAVLDSRLETARGYGSFLRKSLPPFWYTTKPDVVEAALRRLAGEALAVPTQQGPEARVSQGAG